MVDSVERWNQRCSGESNVKWPYAIGSSLLYHYGQGFMVDPNYVAKEDQITGQIEFTGPTIDQKSGGLTGTDTLGALWYGRLRLEMIPIYDRVKTHSELEVMMVVPFGLI